MDITRRNFLKGVGAATASMCLPLTTLWPSSSNAATFPSNPKKLVLLMFKGGNDGINTAIPLSQYSLYSGMRSSIAIPQADVLFAGTDSSGYDIGLHPSFASLEPFFGNLAIFPATHTGPGSDRSHFFQHDLYDEGLATGVTGIGDGKGWVGRYLDNKYGGAAEGVVAEDFAQSALGLMRGDTFVLDVSTPDSLDLGTASSAQADAIWSDIRGVSSAAAGSYAATYAQTQEQLFTVLDRVRTNVAFNRIPDASVSYPATTLGSQFKKTVDMFLGLPEIEVVHILLNGFDTHRNQGGGTGQQAKLLADVSDSLAAFYTDLSTADPNLLNNVVVATMTEFGRTAQENGNGGTDHGQASCWFVFGGPVNGGIYDVYPGIDPATELESGRWLRSTTDYRDILSTILGQHMGAADPNAAFPNYSGPTTPLNLFG